MFFFLIFLPLSQYLSRSYLRACVKFVKYIDAYITLKNGGKTSLHLQLNIKLNVPPLIANSISINARLCESVRECVCLEVNQYLYICESEGEKNHIHTHDIDVSGYVIQLPNKQMTENVDYRVI